MLQVTYECLMKALKAVKPGMRYRDVGDIITSHATQNGFSVIKTYCGHGICDLFHCAPNVPHYKKNKAKGVMQVRLRDECATLPRACHLARAPVRPSAGASWSAHSVRAVMLSGTHALQECAGRAHVHDRADDQRGRLSRHHVAGRLDLGDGRWQPQRAV